MPKGPKGETRPGDVIGVEGFWSILKSGVIGTYHRVSRKYFPLYVADFQFRYNHRRNADIFGAAFGTMLERSAKVRLIALILASFLLTGAADAWSQQPQPETTQGQPSEVQGPNPTERQIEPNTQSQSAQDTMAGAKKDPAPKVKRGTNEGRERKSAQESENGWTGWAWVKNPITLFNALIVLFTCALAVSTGFLWWETKKAANAAQEGAAATRKAVELAERNAERQLRAYVSVNPGRFWELDPHHRTALSYHIMNSGETPAYNLRHGAVLTLAPFPLPPNYPFPEIKFSGGTFLPRNFPNLTGEASVEKAFTQEEIVTILKGESPGTRAYLFGEVRYDSFERERYVRFCFSMAGWFDAAPLAEQGSWTDLNKAVAGVTLFWHHNPTYNNAD